MHDDFPVMPAFLVRKDNPRQYTDEERKIMARHKKASSGIVWPSEKQIARAMRKRERERKEDAASKIEIGSMRIRRGQ